MPNSLGVMVVRRWQVRLLAICGRQVHSYMERGYEQMNDETEMTTREVEGKERRQADLVAAGYCDDCGAYDAENRGRRSPMHQYGPRRSLAGL